MSERSAAPLLVIPKIGLGTYRLNGAEGEKAIVSALEAGYTHIDTARMYENEEQVGNAVRKSGNAREKLFMTTKIWPDDFHKLIAATEDSLRKLKTDYVDLLLLHWPSGENTNDAGANLLNEALHKGYAKNVGVSNFNLKQLEKARTFAPVVCNQVEYHSFLSQEKMLAYVRDQGLMLTAYRPLAHGKAASDPVLMNIGEKYGKTASQVALRWLVQQENVAAIPKAASPERIRENLAVFDFALSPEDMAAISALPKDQRLTDPAWGPKWD